jgi:hypothetical protein
MRYLFGTRFPDGKSRGRNGDHRTHALGLGIVFSVPEQAADIFGNFLRPDIEPNQAIPLVTQVTAVEIEVTGEEGRSAHSVQERDDRLIGYSCISMVIPDLADGDPPAQQQSALGVGNVFVEDSHAEAASSTA